MKRSLKPVHMLLIAIVLLIIGLQPVAASSLVDSRIRQLEFQVRSLQNQIGQLSNNRPRTGNNPAVSHSASLVEAPLIPGDPTFAQQFDNLAVLAIELRQRIDVLEEQVAQLRQ
ncbi:MAG: hypothetical protein AAF703_02375 [Cyanobacteria bacterium P01_D01_bin.105]